MWKKSVSFLTLVCLCIGCGGSKGSNSTPTLSPAEVEANTKKTLELLLAPSTEREVVSKTDGLLKRDRSKEALENDLTGAKGANYGLLEQALTGDYDAQNKGLAKLYLLIPMMRLNPMATLPHIQKIIRDRNQLSILRFHALNMIGNIPNLFDKLEKDLVIALEFPSDGWVDREVMETKIIARLDELGAKSVNEVFRVFHRLMGDDAEAVVPKLVASENDRHYADTLAKYLIDFAKKNSQFRSELEIKYWLQFHTSLKIVPYSSETNWHQVICDLGRKSLRLIVASGSKEPGLQALRQGASRGDLCGTEYAHKIDEAIWRLQEL
jgi:hypothetical protein